MKLRARWTGHLPEVGDVLRSPGPRARCAYVIVGVKIVSMYAVSSVSLDYTTRNNGSFSDVDYRSFSEVVHRVVFEVARVGLDELPTGAAIHAWTWDKRDRRPA